MTAYEKRVTADCGQLMPACRTYRTGFCQDDTSAACGVSADCVGRSACAGRCLVTTTRSCDAPADCLNGETCTYGGPEIPATFASDNLATGSESRRPLNV